MNYNNQRRFVVTLLSFVALSLNVIVHTNALTVSSAQVANGAATKLVITLSADVDNGASTLVAGEWGVSIAGGAVSAPSGIAVAAGKLELTIPQVTHGQSVSYQFTDTTSEIKDSSNNELATFTSTSAVNNVKPVLSSATVGSNSADQVVLTFDGTVQNQGATGNYAVSGGFTVTSISKSGSTVILQLDKPVQSSHSPTVSYTAGSLSMSTGLTVASFANSAITNSVAWTFSTTVSPTIIGRNKATAITFQGSGWTASTSKIKLVKSQTCSSVASGGTGQAVTGAGTGGGVALTFTINENIGTTVSVCFAYDGTNYFHIASTTMTVHPSFTSASISNNQANKVTLTFSDNIGASAAGSAYSLSNSLTITSVTVSGGNVILTTAETIKSTDTGITVSYTAPGGQKTTSSGGSVLAVVDFATQPVTNGITWTFSTTVSPTNVGKDVSTSITFSGTNWNSGTSRIALVKNNDCSSLASGGNGQVVTSATGSTLTFQIDEAANTATTACFAYDGSYYVNIASTTITTQVSAVSNFNTVRTRMAKGESVTFSLTGVGLNSNMQIKYVASGSTCTGTSLINGGNPISLSGINNVAETASVTGVSFSAAGAGLKLCLLVPTANGGTNAFVDQSVTMDVPEITGADITTIGKAVQTKITFTKQHTSTADKVILVSSSSSCSAAGLAGSANEQVLSSSNFITVTITAAQTNALVCLKVQGSGTTGASYTSTGVQITITHPSVTQISFSRISKGNTRTLTITGTGLNTGIKFQINKGNSCNSNPIINEQALTSPNDITTSASKDITLNEAYDNARICFKVPTAQGGTNAYAYNANGVGSFTMDIIELTATNTPKVGLSVQFTSTFTVDGGFTTSDHVKIVAATTACSGTEITGGGSFNLDSNNKKQLTLGVLSADAKICIKADLPSGETPAAEWQDSGVTITVAAPTVTAISSTDTGSYSGLTADVAADVSNAFDLRLTGTGLSSATKVAIASDSGCTDFLTGATEVALVSAHTGNSGDETTQTARVTFSSVTQANPNAYICIKVLTVNGGSNPAAHTKMQDADNSNADFKIDVRGSARGICVYRTGSGYKANDGLATNGGFQVRISTSYSCWNLISNDESHGITSIVATFPTECTYRPCFASSSSNENQVHCGDSGAVSHNNVFSGTKTLTVSTDSTTDNKIKNGVATFQDLTFNHWGRYCRVTFTMNSQGGSQVGRINNYYSGNYATRTSTTFDIRGTAQRVVWKNAADFNAGSFPSGGASSDDYVCIAGYECSTQPIIELYDAATNGNKITNNYHHGVYSIDIYIKQTQDTSCDNKANNYGRIYNNRRWKFVNGVMTFPKSNNHNTNPSYVSTNTCSQLSTGSTSCSNQNHQSTTGIWFSQYAKDIGVRVEANTLYSYWSLPYAIGTTSSNAGGKYFDHTMSVKGKATHLELTFDTNNWVQGYSATQSPNSVGRTTTDSIKKPARNAPFVTVLEKDIPNPGTSNRLTDNCVSGVEKVTVAIHENHDATGTHPQGVSYNNEETVSSGHAIFDNNYINEYGKAYRLKFTPTAPVHYFKLIGDNSGVTEADGPVVFSAAFNVGLLTYKKTIKVKEIDANTGDYK